MTLAPLEEFFMRLKFFAKRQSRVKDTFFFWIAHAKLLRQLLKKMKALMNLMQKDTKEVKEMRKKIT